MKVLRGTTDEKPKIEEVSYVHNVLTLDDSFFFAIPDYDSESAGSWSHGAS